MYRFNQSRVRPLLNPPMWAWAGHGIVILMFLATCAYVAFGRTLKASSALHAEALLSTVAGRAAAAGVASRNEEVLGSSPEPTDYFPAGYVNQGRDGDGNVNTYEHD